MIRKELSNTMLPIQRNDSSNTQSAPKRKSAQRKPRMEQSGINFVQQNPQMEQSGRNSDLSTWRIIGRGSFSQRNRRMLINRVNKELNVTGTSTVSCTFL